MLFVSSTRDKMLHNHQGSVTWPICIIRCIVFNAYFTVLNESGCFIQLQNLPFLPFLGLFRQFPPQQRPVSELPMLLYNILMRYNMLEKNWERFG
jgi:hypothetical protein